MNATTLRLLIQSARPHQWIKNAFILLPLLFARKLFDLSSVFSIVQVVGIFCLLTGGVYMINDLVDLEADRIHPVKRKRPAASGRISIRLLQFSAVFFILVSLVWGAFAARGVFICLIVYLVVQFLYNYRLKKTVILDIFCISAGFFLRVFAGAQSIHVQASHWLLICTCLISMFLAMGKRRHELITSEEACDPDVHLKLCSRYSPYLLDQMINVLTGSTLLSYMMYCISADTIQKFHTDRLIYTFPFVLYGILRYLYLMHHENKGDAPEKILVSDMPLLLSVVLWAVTCIWIIY